MLFTAASSSKFAFVLLFILFFSTEFIYSQTRTIYTFGSNRRGELGLVNFNTATKFNNVAGATNTNIGVIRSMCASDAHVAILAIDTTDSTKGRVFAWGLNDKSQVGAMTTNNMIGNMIYNAFESTYASGPITLGSSTWKLVCGRDHTALYETNTVNGEMYASGSNTFGEHGAADTTARANFTSFSSSRPTLNFANFFSPRGSPAVFATSGSTLYAAGSNSFYQLGISANTNSYPTFTTTSTIASPVRQVEGATPTTNGAVTFFLSDDNTLRYSGIFTAASETNTRTSIVAFPGTTAGSVQAIGYGHGGLVVATSSNFVAFGNNTGQRINPSTTTVLTGSGANLAHGFGSNVRRISVGNQHFCAQVNTNAVHCYGSNQFGQLGAGTYTEFSTTMVSMSGLPTSTASISDIACIGDTTIVLMNNGDLYSAGAPLYRGELAYVPTPTPTPSTVLPFDKIYAGFEVSAGITTSGTLYLWGKNNDRGRLVAPTDNCDRSMPTLISATSNHNITQVAFGGGVRPDLADTVDTMFVYALSANNSRAFGWGRNSIGQLSRNSITPEFDPTPSFLPINDTGPTTFASLDAGVSHAATVGYQFLNPTTPQYIAWGDNRQGQMGFFNNPERLYAIALQENAVQVAAGDYHTLVYVASQGQLLAAGSNSRGAMGLPFVQGSLALLTAIDTFTGKPITKIYAGASTSFVVVRGEGVYVFGDNSFGQLGLTTPIGQVRTPVLHPTLPDTVVKIASAKSGGAHTVVFLEDGSVQVFGRNDEHQLGLGDNQHRYTPTTLNLNMPADTAALDIAVGYRHTLVLSGQRTCPNNCNNVPGFRRGECRVSTGTCRCEQGFTGLDCAQLSCEDPTCGNGNGVCDTTLGVCICSANFNGDDCKSRRCPNNCGGRGVCQPTTGQCSCLVGWSGLDCSVGSGVGSISLSLIAVVFALALYIL